MQPKIDALTCFGKVPTHGDFVRYRSDGDLARAFDAWLQQGLYTLKSRSVTRQQHYDRSLPFAFCFRERAGETALVGAMQPSHDRVGRRYPLVVARELDRVEARDTPRLPVEHAAYLASVQQIAVQAASGTVEYRDLESILESIRTTEPVHPSDAFENFLAETRFASVVTHTWGYFEDARKYLVIKNLLDARDGSDVARVASSGIRLPLGSGRGAEGYEAAFWLEVCDRILHVRWEACSFFWTSGETANEPGSLVLFPGAPPPSGGFVALFAEPDGSYAGDGALDTQEQGRERAVDAVLALPARYGEILEDERMTLRDLLDRL